MAVFPLAYASIFPAPNVPIIAMLLGLIFRGVAFEFRFRTERWRHVWDVGFAVGSIVAALMQGIALGALVQGIRVADRTYAGGWWDWLTPFSVVTGLALVIGYGLLGATWLNLKTTGALRERARRLAQLAGIATLALIGVVSLWTPFLEPVYFARWFGWPTALFSAIVPLLLAICALGLWRGLTHDRHALPFFCALGIFVLCFAEIGISFYPYIVPGALTIAEAAAPDASLGFLLVGTVVLVPIILAYRATPTGYSAARCARGRLSLMRQTTSRLIWFNRPVGRRRPHRRPSRLRHPADPCMKGNLMRRLAAPPPIHSGDGRAGGRCPKRRTRNVGRLPRRQYRRGVAGDDTADAAGLRQCRGHAGLPRRGRPPVRHRNGRA